MAKQNELHLGDDVEDWITGVKGVVVAITNWLNGCQRVTIQPRNLKDGVPVDMVTFDVDQLIPVASSLKKTGTDDALAPPNICDRNGNIIFCPPNY